MIGDAPSKTTAIFRYYGANAKARFLACCYGSMTVGAMAETGIALISTDCVSIAVRRNYHGGVSDGHLRLYGPRTARDCLKLIQSQLAYLIGPDHGVSSYLVSGH
jgi:hypothetical protein